MGKASTVISDSVDNIYSACVMNINKIAIIVYLPAGCLESTEKIVDLSQLVGLSQKK
jgi:hypothetical protein